jgi:alpha-1,3-glucosyltransferase
VIIADVAIFYVSSFLLLGCIFKRKDKMSNNDYLISFLLTLLNPALVLIDHGHFQYNCISLGLMQLAVYFLASNQNSKARSSNMKRLCLASLMFTLALNYKQMELYHSLPFFFYLLGICFHSLTYGEGFVFSASISIIINYLGFYLLQLKLLFF